MTYARIHWSVFNVLVRLFGIMSTITSLVFIGWSAVFALYPEKTTDVSDAGFGAAPLFLTGGLVCTVVAIVLLRARPYRPDLGDSVWGFRTNKLPSQTGRATLRSWWTGEPKSE